ncbi:unnamed protein product [Heterobilharzia americana]|nr:unnamed protein product [Heterobilharzia americana]
MFCSLNFCNTLIRAKNNCDRSEFNRYLSIITVGGIFYHSVRKHSDKLHETIKRIITCLATVAAFMVLIGFLGLFGVCLESPDILSLYSVGLFCIILLHLGTGIACLLHQGEMWDNLHLIMKKAVETYHTDRNMGIMLDKIHRNLHCCGARNHLEYGNNIPLSCQEDGFVYLKGCTDALNEFVGKFLMTIAILSFLFISVEVLSIGFSICLAAYISSMDER